MKKVFMCIVASMVVLLAACGDEKTGYDELPLGVEDTYRFGNEVILDAIVDTDAEYTYLKELHAEYEQLRADYSSARRYASAVISRGDSGEIQTASQQISTFRSAMENFKAKLATITLPSEYGQSLNEAVSYYIQLMNNEVGRLVSGADSSMLIQKTESEAMTEKEFEKAEELNRVVQQNYMSIMKKR